MTTTDNRTKRYRAGLIALFFISGAAGLGYQVIWSKMLAAGVGHEMPAVLAVMTAFLGGMACGAWVLGRRIASSAYPWRWYGALEGAIGIWGVATAVLLPEVNAGLARWLGVSPQPVWHFLCVMVVTGLVLLPGTMALGATLPAMERYLGPLQQERRCVGAVYAANTLGAVGGVLGMIFIVVPAVGFRTALMGLAGINLVVGILAMVLGRILGHGSRTSWVDVPGLKTVGWLRSRLVLTGLLGIGYEVVVIRVLSQSLENTIYTFSEVLVVYLVGTALGAWIYQRHALWKREPNTLEGILAGSLSGSCVAGVVLLAFSDGIYRVLRNGLGEEWLGAVVAELIVSGLVLGGPTVCMGVMFSHLAQAARDGEPGLGRAFALNTLGGAVAVLVFGVIFLPWLGPRWASLLVVWGYLLLFPRSFRKRVPAIGLMLVVGLWTLALPLGVEPAPPEARMIARREGILGTVSVLETGRGERVLKVNRRFQMGGTAAAKAEYRQAHLPLLLHPAPKRALFLGVGTGITLGAATLHPELQSEGVELVPEVVAVLPLFEPSNLGVSTHPHVTIHVSDARRFVKATPHHYDVVVGDLFHPARDGEGLLYTREHYAAIRDRLAEGGLFVQWLPLDLIDALTLQVMIRTFLDVFPNAQAWLLRYNVDAPVVGLVGPAPILNLAKNEVERRLSHEPLRNALGELALTSSLRIWGHFLAGPESLARFAGVAPSSTDDWPWVTFRAPEFAARRGADSFSRLMALVRSVSGDVETALRTAGVEDPMFLKRLVDYLRARNEYLKGLVYDQAGRTDAALDAYLASVRLSDDFTSGYGQCVSFAAARARTEPKAARQVLEQLVRAQPDNPVAGDLLKRLFP